MSDAKPDHEKAFMKQVGHQLRDPLGDIVSLVDLMLLGTEGKVSAKMRDHLQHIRGFASQSLAAVDKVLELVYPEVQDEEPTVFDVTALVREACENRVSALPPLNRSVRCEGLDQLPSVQADREAIRRAVAILLDSLIRITQHEVVSVSAHGYDQTVIVSFLESAGTATSRLALGKFVRLPRGNTFSLEFLIARRLIEHNGGEFWITGESEDPSDIGFHFSLPCTHKTTSSRPNAP